MSLTILAYARVIAARPVNGTDRSGFPRNLIRFPSRVGVMARLLAGVYGRLSKTMLSRRIVTKPRDAHKAQNDCILSGSLTTASMVKMRTNTRGPRRTMPGCSQNY